MDKNRPRRRTAAETADDKRELYALVRDDRERIAALEGAVESLATSVESGFRNIGNRIDDLVQTQRASRPQISVIATVIFSTCALVGALAGFALKAAVQPLQGQIEAQDRLVSITQLSNDRRILDLENLAHDNIVSAAQQEKRIEANEHVIQEFNKLMLENYVSGSVGAAKTIHTHE